MRIGIDLDDTITKTDEILFKYAKIYNEEEKILFNINREEWNLTKAFGWNEENIKAHFSGNLRYETSSEGTSFFIEIPM